MLETVMREALDRLQRLPEWQGKYMASAVTANAVIDEDQDRDGRMDPNPDTGQGGEAGNFTIAIYPVWSPPASPPSPVLMLDERGCVDLGLTTADAIVAHVKAQVG